MLDYREPQENEGNDGYIWSKRLVSLLALGVTLVGMVISVGYTITGGFVGFSE